MNINIKKILSLVLAGIFMCLAMVTPVFADESETAASNDSFFDLSDVQSETEAETEAVTEEEASTQTIGEFLEEAESKRAEEESESTTAANSETVDRYEEDELIGDDEILSRDEDMDFVYEFYIKLNGVEKAEWVILKVRGEDGQTYKLKFEKSKDYYLEPGLSDGNYEILSVKTNTITDNVEVPLEVIPVKHATNILVPCTEKVDNFFIAQLKTNWMIILILLILVIAYFKIPKERREYMKANGI